MRRLFVVVSLFALCILGVGCNTPVPPTECFLGLAGTKASITLKGIGAVDECKTMRNQIVKVGSIEYRLVELDKRPTEPIVCQPLSGSGHEFTVRDDAPFGLALVGSALCQMGPWK
jgi:hypothetical protein